MIETEEQRTTIRQNYRQGHEESLLMLATTPAEQREILQITVAIDLINSDGYEYNHQQGIWHVVGQTALCQVRQHIPEGAI
jgi:hypothetical protein